ncbi:hypothetical protein CHS0354_009156, partial [Potamilus streckersoni]
MPYIDGYKDLENIATAIAKPHSIISCLLPDRAFIKQHYVRSYQADYRIRRTDGERGLVNMFQGSNPDAKASSSSNDNYNS